MALWIHSFSRRYERLRTPRGSDSSGSSRGGRWRSRSWPLAAAFGRTVVHHLKRLEAAGLVESTPRRPYVEYALRVDRLAEVSKQLAGLERADEAGDQLAGPDGEALPAYDAKVLRAFLRDGRLVSIPAQERKREAVLRYLMRTASTRIGHTGA